MKWILLCPIIVFYFNTCVYAQNLQPPVSVKISSDYGPRKIGESYNWHWGNDYAASMWTHVAAVESGNITEIEYDPPPVKGWSSGWYIKVSTGAKTWAYLHLSTGVSNNNPISPNGVFEIKKITLEDPNTQIVEQAYAFIFWDNKAKLKASKVLVKYNQDALSRHVRWGNGYILSAVTGSSITVQESVSAGELIAYSGQSGNVPQHLDIRVRSAGSLKYDINPLYYIHHDTPTYSLNLLAPEDGSTLFHITGKPEKEQVGERIRLNVNSTAGKDLDRVKAHLVTGEMPMEERVFDDTNLLAKIFYGGRPPSELESNPLPTHVTISNDEGKGSFAKTGVSPMGDVGTDDFYFVGFNTKLKPDGKTEALLNRDAKFPDGEYGLVMRAHSIRYNNLDYVAGTAGEGVLVDNYRPYVDTVTIADVNDLENPVYRRTWEFDGSVLTPEEDYPDGPVIPGHTYQVTATMSEYTQHAAMRTQDGTTIPLVSEVNSTDTHNSEYTGEITIPTEFTEDKVVPLVIQDMDIAENPSNALLKIDAGRTSSMDPAKELTRDATGTMLGTAGNDTFHYFRIDAASPIIRYNRQPKNYQALDESCAGNSVELCGTETQPVNITYSSVPFSYTDIGSGLKEVTIYRNVIGPDKFYTCEYSSLLKRKFTDEATMTLPDGKYVQTITDNLGQA